MQISGFASGVSGLKAAESQLDRAAAEVADATVPTDQVTLSGSEPDLLQATTDRISGELLFRANLKTIQAADQMSNELLDLLTRR